jgi:hypothetical protein
VIAHVVLFRPRPALSAGDREALVSAFRTALQAIPSIRRARVGRRVTHGRPGYEQLMRINFPYAAVIEFDDTAGLAAYLAHPAHEQLGDQFFAVFEEALMYDFELADGEDGLSTLL